MKVILNTAMDNLGKAGDIINVKDGYARNYLLPRKIAFEATINNVRALEHQKRIIADRLRKERKEFEGLAQKISESPITIPVQVGEEGKLFGSVTNKDIAEALSREGFQIDKRKIRLEDPIKEVGSFVIPINLHPDVVANLPLHVVSAQAEG
jgi:large subunit ribosomal protein L9